MSLKAFNEETSKLGTELKPDEQQHVLRAYLHRFTGDYKPAWAHTLRNDGTKYMPQFKDDQDWLAHTRFAVRKDGSLDQRIGECYSTPTWPFGKDEPK